MKNFIKYLIGSMLVLVVLTGQLYADCMNIGNYVRGSSPVVGGFVTPHETEHDVPINSASNTTYLSGTTKKPWYNLACSAYMPDWKNGEDGCKYNGYIYSVDMVTLPADWLPRHFGTICYNKTVVWGAYRYYVTPRCPDNTAPIKSVGYVTNDGKNYGAVGKIIASKINLAPANTILTLGPNTLTANNYCPANSEHIGSSRCQTVAPLEVTLCVATDTNE